MRFLSASLDLGGGDGVLVAALEGGVGGEVAAAVAGVAERAALAEEGEDDQVVGAGLGRRPTCRALRMFSRVAFWRAALSSSLAQQQADVLGVDAEVVLVGEQVVQGLGVVLGVGAGLDLLVRVVADADQHHVRPGRLGRFGLNGGSQRQRG